MPDPAKPAPQPSSKPAGPPPTRARAPAAQPEPQPQPEPAAQKKGQGKKQKENSKAKIKFFSIENRIKVIEEYTNLWQKFAHYFAGGFEGQRIREKEEAEFSQLITKLAARHYEYCELVGDLLNKALKSKTLDIICETVSLSHIKSISVSEYNALIESWHKVFIYMNKSLGHLLAEKNREVEEKRTREEIKKNKAKGKKKGKGEERAPAQAVPPPAPSAKPQVKPGAPPPARPKPRPAGAPQAAAPKPAAGPRPPGGKPSPAPKPPAS